jgi:hypothetical protein
MSFCWDGEQNPLLTGITVTVILPGGLVKELRRIEQPVANLDRKFRVATDDNLLQHLHILEDKIALDDFVPAK